MSLQVWLPLTKDLRQQGLSNVTVINNGATFNSAGKLGGCYSFNGSSNYIYAAKNIYSANYSYSLWFYTTSTSATQCLGCCRTAVGVGFAIFLIGGKLRIDGGSSSQWTTNYTYPANTWVHLTITYSNSTIKYYINGEYQQSYSAGLDSTKWGNTYSVGASQANGSSYGNYLTGKINDVRIYDHCLSPMEVKELAKGLVLHYPLNRQGWGQENLARNTGVRAPDSTSQVEFRAFKVGNLPIVAGETITVSFDLKMEIGTAITNGTPYLYVYNTNYRGPHGQWISFTNKVATPFIPIGNYAVGDIFEKRVFFTTTVASSFNPGTNTEDWIEFYSNYDTENKITINNLKIERGTIATPWCPHIEDANNMGLNSMIEYDCSGFCNNSNRNMSTTYSSDVAKYSVSTYFGAYNTPKTELIDISFLSSLTNCSIAWWAKTDVAKTLFFAGQDSNHYAMASNNNNFYHKNVGSPIIYRDGVADTYTNEAGVWHHYVMTGVNLSSWTQFKINSYSSWPLKGLINDVRIYATVLSADDVKSLYQNCATIDPDGTIRGQIRS